MILKNFSLEIPENFPKYGRHFLRLYSRIGKDYEKFLGMGYKKFLRIGYKKFLGLGYGKQTKFFVNNGVVQEKNERWTNNIALSGK